MVPIGHYAYPSVQNVLIEDMDLEKQLDLKSNLDLEFLLDEMEISTDPFALCELYGRCDLGLGRDPSATLHYVLAGQGEIVLHDRPAVPVRRGSLVLIPALRHHTLRCFGDHVDPLPACRPAGLDLVHLIHGDTPDPTGGRLIALCARVTLGLRSLQNVIDLVRDPIAATVYDGSALAASIGGMLREISAPGPGSRAIIRSLLLICMIEMIRQRLSAGDASLAWMSALRDPRLWPALRRMTDAPGEPHSVDSLADISGMSRSAFAKRFTEAYGKGPMDLLRDLRMRLASSLLSNSDLPVKRIAEIVGFRSRSAFTRTFEGATGMSPQEFRGHRPDY